MPTGASSQRNARAKPRDASSHVLARVARSLQQREFVQRYGDVGEDEFGEAAGTIPRRLILMNVRLVQERTKEELVMHAATRIAAVAPDLATALEAAHLATLTRRPTPEEQHYFLGRWQADTNTRHARAMEDLYWTLINTTESSWNH